MSIKKKPLQAGWETYPSQLFFSYSSQLFWEPIRIRYGWALNCLNEKFAFGGNFDFQHIILFKKGGFVSNRHNQTYDITRFLVS